MTIKANFKDLPTSSTPIFSYCRKLIKDGVDPNTGLELYRTRKEYDVCVPNIGVAAKLTVREDPSPHFVKYRPPQKERADSRIKG